MYRPHALGHEDVDRLPDQLVASVTEKPLGLGVDEGDAAPFVDTQDGVGGRLEETEKTWPRSVAGRSCPGH